MENTEQSLAITTVNPPKTSWLKKVLLGLLTIIVIVALIALTWRQQRFQEDEQQQTHRALKQQVAADQSLQQQLQQQRQQQQTQFAQLQQQITHLTQQANGNSKSWKIAEIAYLIRLADMQLQLQSTGIALNLLKQSQTQASVLNDPRLTNFQQALTALIDTVQKTTTTDTFALNSQLNTLQTQVPALALLTAPTVTGSALVANTPHQQHKKWWQRAWDNIKVSFKELVIVQHAAQPLPALMPPQQQVYLQQNLQLLLVQARLALLNHQFAVYTDSLHQAQTWVSKYYVPNSAATQSFMQQLTTLQAVPLVSLPSTEVFSHLLALLPQE